MFYYAVGLIHFFPLSLTWKFNTGTLSPMNWIGLSVCSTISVKPLELQSRHTHKHSLFLGEWARALKTFIQITHCNYKVLFRKAYTNTHTHTELIAIGLIIIYIVCTHALKMPTPSANWMRWCSGILPFDTQSVLSWKKSWRLLWTSNICVINGRQL